MAIHMLITKISYAISDTSGDDAVSQLDIYGKPSQATIKKVKAEWEVKNQILVSDLFEIIQNFHRGKSYDGNLFTCWHFADTVLYSLLELTWSSLGVDELLIYALDLIISHCLFELDQIYPPMI